jgi:hypothetical protein
MNLTDISNIRMISQQIERTKLKTAKDIVGWMGAMQAQDYAMAKWAIGLRLPKSTDQAIETAVNDGEILRTHLLRPTWHFVSADDIYWMLELTAPKIKESMRSRHKQLGLTDAIFTKSNSIIEKALRGGKHLTREELLVEIGNAKIVLDGNRASHLLTRAELDGIVCSGATKNGKQTYALLEEWVQKAKPLDKEEALVKLAKIYFSSRCPATFQDFVWWSGLPINAARYALEMVKSDFISEAIQKQIYCLPNSYSPHKEGKDHVICYPPMMNSSSATKTGVLRYLLKTATRPFRTMAYSGLQS